MNLFADAVCAIEAFFFAYTGWLGFAQPRALSDRLGLQPSGAAGLNEVRSQYGGFYGALAIVQAAGLLGWLPMTAALGAGLLAFGGLMLGRLASVVVDGSLRKYTPTLKWLTFLDPLGFFLTLSALAVEIGQL
jgi:hypothetical protein